MDSPSWALFRPAEVGFDWSGSEAGLAPAFFISVAVEYSGGDPDVEGIARLSDGSVIDVSGPAVCEFVAGSWGTGLPDGFFSATMLRAILSFSSSVTGVVAELFFAVRSTD